MNKQLVVKYISVIRRACDLLEQQLEEDVSQAFEEIARETSPVVAPKSNLPSISLPPLVAKQEAIQPQIPTPEIANPEEDKAHVAARLKHIDDLMGIDCWPASIPQFQADAKPTDTDYVNRANSVLDMCLGASIEGAHFLDYGCGDGFIASEIAARGPDSITGYDIVPSDYWQKLGTDKVNFTCDVNALTPKGYDLVFLYDVLDHSIDPEGVMRHIKHLAVPGAVVYVRCHPWTSKHASHLPKVGLNKAYIHLFLTFEELVQKGFKPLFTRIEKVPLDAYRWWFRDFKIVKEKPYFEDVSQFFKEPAFKELLANEQQLKASELNVFMDNMKLQFVDFVLEA